jgi:hypothetical protein
VISGYAQREVPFLPGRIESWTAGVAEVKKLRTRPNNIILDPIAVGAEIHNRRQAAKMTEKWRKINIDQYDEDVVLDSELYDPDPRDSSTILADAKGKAQLVRSALAKLVVPSLVPIRGGSKSDHLPGGILQAL